MRATTFSTLLICTVSLLAGLQPHAFASSLNQAEALAAASEVNKSGSDESLQNSTTSAMRAMLELGNQNKPGAMKNGYKAFGEYRTSEDLDVVRMKNRIRQIDLFTSNVSIHTKVPEWAKKREVFTTTYGRLDPSFMRKGEAGKVAEEFERKSGMKREDFLKRMAEASESRISEKDPKLTEKVLGRLAGFVDEIPNSEFRENIKKEIESVSTKSKASLIRDGVERVFEVLASHNISVAPKVALKYSETANEVDRGLASSPTESSVFIGGPVAAQSGPAEDPLQSSKKNFIHEMAPRDSDFRGLGQEKFSGDPLGSVMQTALDEQAELTIFKQVSKRYRAVTPYLGLVKE